MAAQRASSRSQKSQGKQTSTRRMGVSPRKHTKNLRGPNQESEGKELDVLREVKDNERGLINVEKGKKDQSSCRPTA